MKRATTLLILLSLTAAAYAAAPPDRMHYQGVLRDAAGDPLDGSYDMVFKLFSEETLGDEILLDRHLAVNLQAVEVADGLFAAGIGDGEILDGSGPGTYTSLAEVFGNHGDVWLEIEIGSETLAPRMRIAAAGYALNAGRLDGRPAGEFVDTSTGEQSKQGKLVVGQVSGTADDNGIEGYGSSAGGFFESTQSGGFSRVGYLDWGIYSEGNYAGGQFEDGNASGYALVGYQDYGIQAHGLASGGYFIELSSTARAHVASDGYGIRANGPAAGAYFHDDATSGYAYVGNANIGIEAYGVTHGGKFYDSNGSGRAFVGAGNVGIQAYGDSWGGYFDDTNNSGYAYTAYGDWGGYFNGDYLGARGRDLTSGTYGTIGFGTASTSGNGTKNFVQNHPYRDDQVIVYAAPEGNEVATYTRGSARLVNGEARIALDETFAWVTNPDIGLTAQLTPRTDGAALHVAGLTTGELVVRAHAGSVEDAAFDYMVWGLRIGFEEVSVVREKGQEESPIPSMDEERERLRHSPELRKHVALERFKSMATALGKSASVDLSAATALRDAIGEFEFRPSPPPAPNQPTETGTVTPAQVAEAAVPSPEADRSGALLLPEIDRLPIAEAVREGDLIAVDAQGTLVLAFAEADPAVAGVAAEDSAFTDGGHHVAIAATGMTTLKVDADLGAVRPGDLLMSSPTPGHAMRAYGEIPGTVIAKALEPLEAGHAAIRVLITPR